MRFKSPRICGRIKFRLRTSPTLSEKTNMVEHCFVLERRMCGVYFRPIECCSIDHGYDRFVERAEHYRYRRCISWYLDAMLRDRMVNARIASIAAGIEVLAERYAAHGEDVGSGTPEKIRNLVTSIGVVVDDLAKFSETFEDTPNGTKEYFYSNSRNFVLHNERDDMPFDNVFTDYEASITLFRRLIINEFVLDEERDRYTSLLNLSPKDQRFE